MRAAALVCVSLAGCGVEAPQESVGEQGTTVCGGGPVVKGMDVSKYETAIDWPTARSAGIDFAFIRVSDGLQYLDPKFAAYWQGARDAGVMRGAYQFFRPTEDPIAQADLLLDAIGPRLPDDLPPVIDVETTGGLAPHDVEAAVRAWVDHVAIAIGRRPIIYAGYYSWQDYTGNANLTSSPLWHAQYTSASCPNIPTPWTRWTFWQYTSTGTVPSVTGELTDLDVFDGTVDELHAFADHAPASCGTIGPDGGTIDDVDACFSTGGPAATLRHVDGAGNDGTLVWTHATSSNLIGNFAQWTLDLAEAGYYRVEVATPAAFAQSTRARYRVRAGGELHDVIVDQSAADGWQALGDLAFTAGGDQFIELDDNTGESGGEQLVFDAIRLTRLDRIEPPSGANPDPEPDAGGCEIGGGAASPLLAIMFVLVRRRRT